MLRKKIHILAYLLFTAKILFSQTTYSFFVAGHVYGNPGSDSLGVYYKFKNKFSYITSRPEIKFGVFTGDIVRHPSAEAWDSIDADVSELGLPVYFCAGNHDMYNRTLFEQRYGRTYYSFMYDNDLFIVLDPNLDNWNISQPQLDMIDSALSFNNYENIFVLFHQVLWCDNPLYNDLTPNSYEGKDDTINFWTAVEPRFHNLPNNVYMFAGDVGAINNSNNIFYDNYDNITLIASGMGNNSAYENFIVVNIDSEKNVTFDVVCLNGNSQFCCDDISMYDHYIPLSQANTQKQNIIYIRNYLHVLNFKNTTLDVYDLTGRKIITKQINSEHETVFTGTLKTNIYIINIHSTSTNETYKIFIPE